MPMSLFATMLICCLGNPIGGDDGIGSVVGRHLKRVLPKRDFEVIPEYAGSALDFVLDLDGRQKVCIIDAIITGRYPEGAVRLFTEKQICRNMKSGCFHGVNLSQALVMGRKLKLKLPAIVQLIGIEIRPVSSFGEKLSPALKKRLPAICADVERKIKKLHSG